MQDCLRIVGPFHATSGYSKLCRAVLSTARLAGFTVQAVESDYKTQIRGFAGGKQKQERLPLSDTSKLPEVQRLELEEAKAVKLPPDAPTLFVQLPVQLGGWGEYSTGPRLGWTMVEADTVHHLWANAARNVDGLLLPSRYCADTFRRALPGMSQGILPLPVDPRLYEPEGLRAAIGGRPEFLFFSVFETCERKNWRLLMQAMVEEFAGESVGIVLRPSRAPEVAEFAAYCRTAGLWVMVMDEWVSEEDLAGLYRACDAFALPSAEGFGLPFVEAALCVKPSVALNLGGSAEMVNEATGYPIEAHWTPCVGHMPPLYQSGMHFPSASIGAVRKALRACVEDRASKGEAAREFALAHFTPEALAEGLREAVEEAVCRFEVERKVWQGSVGWELPEVACLIRVQNPERAVLCKAKIEITVPSAHVFFLAVDSLSENLPGHFLEVEQEDCGSLCGLQKGAIASLEAEGFDGFLLLIDDTIEVSPGWWEGLSKIFALCPEVGLLSPKVMIDGGEMKRCGRRLCFDGSWEVMALERTLTRCDAPDQAIYVMRPEVWQQFAFDPQFEHFYDDVDLAVQARAEGWETAATATVAVTMTERPPMDKEYLCDPMRRRFLRKWKGAF